MKLLLILSVSVLFSGVLGWGSSNKERVLLSDVKAITLESGKMTTGRRSSPVPQLSCTGGSAGCYGSNQPRSVQCLNRGSDGVDAQWECQATMDDDYQFGRIRVVCEGYEYPEDPYVLKGSCGLEYELDYTQKGRHNQGNSHHGGGNSYHGGNNYQSESKSGGFGGFIQFIIVVAIIFFLCSCIRRPRQQGAPPGYAGAGYGGSGSGTGTGTGGGGGGPGFWSGAATGGALGYMFGNRGNTGYGNNYGGGWGSRGGGWGSGGSGWGSGGSGWGSGGSGRSSSRRSGSSSSSSSRSTSGFGGTGRR